MNEAQDDVSENAAMRSWAVTLAVEGAQARVIADALGECLDPSTAAVTFFESAAERWTIALDFSDPPDLEALRNLVAAIGGAQAAEGLTVHPVRARDWVAASLAGLAPVRAGRFVVHGAHDRASLRGRAIAIEIEAALAFGTGHHGTTRGCLLMLDRLLKQRRLGERWRVLDLGSGTGVLAFAAAKALRQKVLASDIDRQAVRVARGNARANGVGPLVEFVQAAGLAAPRLRGAAPDLVLANILLPPLQRLAAPLARRVRPGGRIVLSGLLRAHANAALAAYRLQGFFLAHRIDVEGWTTFLLTRAGAHRRKRSGHRGNATGPGVSRPGR